MIGGRGEIPSEHGVICSGEKNGRAAAGEKSGAAGEKIGVRRGKVGCFWSAKHQKKSAVQRPGKKWSASATKKTAVLWLRK